MQISEKDRRLRKRLTGVLAFLFSMASLFFLYYAYTQVSGAIHSDRWPTTNGVVVSSRLSFTKGNMGVNKSANSYNPVVGYTYVVDGREYKSEKLQFVQDGMGRSWAEQKLDRYPVGTVVEVAYDPDEPERAVLETGGKLKWYLFVIAAAVTFFAVFAVLALFLYRDHRKMVRLAPATDR